MYVGINLFITSYYFPVYFHEVFQQFFFTVFFQSFWYFYLLDPDMFLFLSNSTEEKLSVFYGTLYVFMCKFLVS